MRVGDVHGPDASASADVEDGLRGGDGGVEELVADGEADGVIHDVNAVLFVFIVGEEVFCRR